MIGALKGIVHAVKKNPIVFFAGDVGYAVSITDRLAKTLQPEKKTLLFIHTHVRDDALDLFGFASQEELALFELLLTVSGVGPKTALLVMNAGSDAIKHAVQIGDVDFFTTIPRLGKKNAQKIIIELKNKLGSVEDLNLRNDESSETDEMIDALVSMGFAKKEVLAIIKKIPTTDTTIEQKLKSALKLLGK
ncbi:MAG: Holliday junction branch migration protein RuvA [Candidatus Gottesmanbacteria bacterium]